MRTFSSMTLACAIALSTTRSNIGRRFFVSAFSKPFGSTTNFSAAAYASISTKKDGFVLSKIRPAFTTKQTNSALSMSTEAGSGEYEFDYLVIGESSFLIHM